MRDIKLNDKGEITINYEDFLSIVKEVALLQIANASIDEAMSKPQMNMTEAYRYFEMSRVNKWIKAGLLKPTSQNGKGAKKYLSTKKMIELSLKSYHCLDEMIKKRSGE
ncbi:hypothetical protein ACR79T_12585 [Sphingobacterium spiritivorum]|uniref:hypothetical protein n=1 Tax=Sphingobacterium spiritivorum TaxID=258 RepID=UPI003DA3BD08